MSAAPPIAPMRPGFGSMVFVAVMLGASVFSVARLLAVAWLMPVEVFAAYTAIVAIGAFASGPLSFGTVEATMKAFPRLVAEGRTAGLRPEGYRALMVVTRRAVLVGVPAFALARWSGLEWLEQATIGLLFAVATAHSSIMASKQRALGHPARLAAGTVLRVVATLLAVLAATASQDLTVLLVAEAGAIFASCLLSDLLFVRPLVQKDAGRGQDARAHRLPSEARRDGVRLFIAFSIVSVPFYLDRPFIIAVLGEIEGARYAVLAILLTGASLLVNAIAQRVGPDALRLVHGGQNRAAFRQVFMWSAIAGSLWIMGVGLMALIVAGGWLPPQLQRYAIEPVLLAPIAAAGALLTTALVEFLLIASDRETAFQRAAAGFLVTVLLLAGLAVWLEADLLAIMWLLVAARTIYAMMLLLALPWRELHSREGGHGQS